METEVKPLSKYEQAKEIEHRITEFTLLKRYFHSFLSCKPFSITITTSTIGQTTQTPINCINGRQTTEMLLLSETEDGKYILDCMQKRIDELKTEFKNLTN